MKIILLVSILVDLIKYRNKIIIFFMEFHIDDKCEIIQAYETLHT